MATRSTSEGMTPGAFMAELRKYPVVRSRDYIGPMNLAGSADKARTQSATVAPTTTTRTVSAAAAQSSTSGGSTPSQPPQVSFMAQLRGLLGEHYSAEDVSTIMREFETAHFKWINSLSLEDVEDMAVLLAKESQTTTASATASR